MSDVFTRGGQLWLHAFRMFRQVAWVFTKCILGIMAVVMLYICVTELSAHEVKTTYYYGIASLFTSFGSGKHQLLMESITHRKIVMSAAQVVADPYIQRTIMQAAATVLKAFTIGVYASMGFLLIASIFIYKKGSKFAKDDAIRGAELISQAELSKLISEGNKKLGYKDGYSLVNIPYPAYSETMHTLIAGSTGSGKTVVISDLIAQIKKRGDRAIIFDKMGVYTERFYNSKSDTILNPFDSRSPNWSIFKEVSHDANFDAIASAFIPLDKGNADTFWIKAARTLFAEVCSALLKRGGVSNKELVNTLLKKNLEEAAQLVKGTAAQAIIDDKSPKTALSVMAVLSTYLKCLKFLRDEGGMFSIRDWVLKENDGCVFITSSGDLHSTLTPLISAWLEIAINNILSLDRSRDRKIWIILDELPSLHSLPSLEQGLAETRQFGGCFVLSIQSISQLRDRYGHNGSQTISALCNNKVFLRAGDFDSARWYSDNIGTLEVEEVKEGLSYGAHQMRDGVNISKHKYTKSLVLPTELLNLNDRQGYFCMSKGYPIAKVEFDYQNWPSNNQSLVFSAQSNDEETQDNATPANEDLKITKKEAVIKDSVFDC